MFGHYSTPSSHFGQYYPSSLSRSTHYYPSPSSSSSRNSCSAQYHRHPSAFRPAHYLDDDDDDEASSSDYYEYLDAARREQERKELLEAQARRRVQEERALQYARAEAQLRAARAREEREREREYREYAERQLEARREAQVQAAREAHIARALQLQQEREQEQERERAQEQEEVRQRKIRQLHLQQQEQQRERLLHQRAQHEKQRQSQASFDGEDLARAIFGQLGWSPVTPSHQYQPQEQRGASSPSSTIPAQPAVQPIKSVPAHAQPAVKPLPSFPSINFPGQTLPAEQQQSKMSYTAAVNLVQGLAKEQIDLRQRLRSLHSLREQFSSLKSSFVLPQSLIFDTTAKSTTAETPALAYTAQNRPLQAYEEALTRILTQLDAIPSQGSERIKVARKEIARDVQAELDALDREKVEQWKKLQTTGADGAVPGAAVEEEGGEVALDGAAASAAELQTEETVNEAVAAQEDEMAVDAAPISQAEMVEQFSSQGDGAEEQIITSKEAEEPVVQMDTDIRPISIAGGKDTDTTQHNQTSADSAEIPSASTSAGLDLSQNPSTSSDHSPTASDNEEATPTALPPSSGEVISPSAEPPLQQSDTTVPSTSVEKAPERPSLPRPTTDLSSALSHLSAEESTSSNLPEREDSTPSGVGSSSKSVSATLLPTSPYGALGLIEVLSPASRGQEEEHENDQGSDTGSDTSFEML